LEISSITPHPLDMGLPSCLKEPFILGTIVAPFETFLPYTREKTNKKESPLPTSPKLKNENKSSYISMGRYKM
jgi:hypothetical protein